MNDDIELEREIRLENFLKKVETAAPKPHLVTRWTKTLLELYVAYLKARDPEWPNSTVTFNHVFRRQQDLWVHMYVHGPVQRRIDEVLKSLREKDYAAVERALVALASEHGGKEISSEIQSHNSSHKHRKRAYEKLQEDIVRANPRIGHKEFEKELKKHVGKGVIVSMDDSLNEIRLNNDDRIFKISGLKDRLTKLRNTI